ncbi:MAG TPA: chorismate-binding protein [Mycobacteriales bacterium]|nr:chorismate-binding protein [Mycobacteriales bacterium]
MIRAPGQPAVRVGSWIERDRWEWHWTPGAELPYTALEDFLAGAGLPVRDLAGRPERPDGDLGAVLLIGGGWPVSAAGGAASPCPTIPDIVAVVVEGALVEPAPAEPPDPAGPEPLTVGEWQESWSSEEHRHAVEKVRRSIARGDVYQASVVGHRSASWAGTPRALGRRLDTVPDAPWSGGVAGGGTGDSWSVHAASPELFLDVTDGRARTRPIKGTTARSDDAVVDRAAYEALRASAKDRAEHVMIVDLERNDLAQVAVTGGVDVTELYVVRPLAGLWHAESTVSGELRAGVGLADLLAATFPGGSVTGAPKRAALAEIAQVEPVGRGPSMGALGWVGANATVRLGLTIRTVAAADARLHLWTGGGVTWSSDPASEVAEAAAKAAPLIGSLAAR